MKIKTNMSLEDQVEYLETLLSDLVTQVDEDCPSEYRTEHLRDAMNEAFLILGYTVDLQDDSAELVNSESNSEGTL